MKRLILLTIIFFFYSYKNFAQDSTSFQKFFSKKYNLEFVVENILLDSLEIKSPEKVYGQIRRDNDYIYSKSSFGFGILQDSLCLFVDDSLEIVTLDGSFTLGPRLLIPFYDPLAILNYARTYNNAYNKIVDKKKINHDFRFPDTIPARQILIIEDKKDNSFTIEFTYQSLEDKIKNIIRYKIIPGPIGKEIKNIKDFIEERDGKFILKPELKGYAFFNSLSLESIFKH